jgi:hypothetical protein
VVELAVDELDDPVVGQAVGLPDGQPADPPCDRVVESLVGFHAEHQGRWYYLPLSSAAVTKIGSYGSTDFVVHGVEGAQSCAIALNPLYFCSEQELACRRRES